MTSAMLPLSDKLYMQRCLRLAERAEGNTCPNPVVGAVIVHENNVIGEGYHQYCGGAHAEVNAINAVADKAMLQASTLYVNLEPCSHFGKTPPCSRLIIEKQIPRVVVGMKDPNPNVNGQGIAMLQKAGISVIVGVEEQACRRLNRRFITLNTQHRPYIILKWAQSADGFMDACRSESTVSPVQISNPVTKLLNHGMRTQEAAILVGTNTALLDNPHLTVRKWHGRNPLRMVIDRKGRIPDSYHIYDGEAETVIFTEQNLSDRKNTHFERIDFNMPLVEQLTDYLYRRHISSLIVEGGRQLLDTFFASGIWDECHIETAPIHLHSGIAAPPLPTARKLCSRNYCQNVLDTYINSHNSFFD
jgi:diaminohydroxyphosphoribosylaminopyrimidine deaminase/5-amino-6-(5-phosphoribosylamino)uracil reductase